MSYDYKQLVLTSMIALEGPGLVKGAMLGKMVPKGKSVLNSAPKKIPITRPTITPQVTPSVTPATVNKPGFIRKSAPLTIGAGVGFYGGNYYGNKVGQAEGVANLINEQSKNPGGMLWAGLSNLTHKLTGGGLGTSYSDTMLDQIRKASGSKTSEFISNKLDGLRQAEVPIKK